MTVRWPDRARSSERAHAAAITTLLLLAAPAAVRAQMSVAQETVPRAAVAQETVQITATRVPTGLRDTTESITVLSRAQIEQLGAAGGSDLFRQIPGLQIDQLGGPGGLSSVYIRGSDSNHVLVLIDGVRVNDPSNSRGGGFDMSNLDPAAIERIEVLRGAASAVYGAEAMGGVINIVTRNGIAGEGTQGSVSAAAGGQRYGRVGANVAAGSGGLRLAAGASRLRDGSDTNGGRIDLKQANAAARWSISPAAQVDLDLRHTDRDSSAFPDDSGGVRLATLRTLEQKTGSDNTVSARGQWVASQLLTLLASATRYQHAEDIVSPGVAPGLRSDFGVPSSVSHTDFQRSNVSASAVFHLGADSALALGAEHQRERGDNHTVYDFFGMEIPVDFELTRRTRSEFAELKWLALQNLTVRAGVRHDAVDGNGSHTSPSLGLRYNLPTADASLKASYSEGFKPPSFFALGLPVALGGNPDLRAERNKGGSIGYEQGFWGRRATAGVALFRTRYTDLVTFDNATNQTVNANKVHIHGAEFETRLQVTSTLSVQAHFTRLFSRVLDSDEPLRQRPGKRGGVQLSWAPQAQLLLNWRAEYAAQVFDSSIPTGNLTLPTSLRNDVSGSWRFSPGLQLSLAIDNLLDKRNESYVGATAPGRRARVSLRAEL